MSHHRKSRASFVALAVLILAACGGGSNDDTATEATTTEAESTPTTTMETCSGGSTRGTDQDRERCEDGQWVPFPTATVSELERNQKVNEFLDAAEFNANCVSLECMYTDATYSRYLALIDLAGAIPGEDVDSYVDEMDRAWNAWNECFQTAETRGDCGIEEDDVSASIDALYNALR